MANVDVPMVVIKSLETLAQRLDVTMSVLWSVLVRQSYVEGAGFAIVCVSLFIGIMILNKSKRKAGERTIEIEDGSFVYTSSIITLVQVGMGAVITLFSIQAAARFINPEFYAIAKIMDAIKDYL